jgi:hypothetical protein
MMIQTNEWSIPSNNGWNDITFEAGTLHRKSDVLECCIQLTGRNECAAKLDAVPPEVDRVVQNYIIKLPTVLVLMPACDQLMIDFDRWLESYTPFERYLTSTSEQVVTLAVGRRDDLITTADHPAVTFCYDDGRCRLEVLFVVDQSCIRIARDGLAATMRPFTRFRGM